MTALTGGADVRVSWWQDDRELDSSRSTSLVNNYDPYEDVHLNHLLLRHLARSDHGSVYSCKASVHVVPPIAPISSNITLNVRRKWILSPCLFVAGWFLHKKKVYRRVGRHLTSSHNPIEFDWAAGRFTASSDRSIVILLGILWIISRHWTNHFFKKLN